MSSASVVADTYAPATSWRSPGERRAGPTRSRRSSTEDQPADDERGFVVFFTGLSGSGKSTLARALHDLILEDGRRTVTSLDGDVVRRNLSAGLTFSKEDRETNIRRIGWVAAEIARHRGHRDLLARSRRSTRPASRSARMVEDAGGVFVLVHVATPLEECERRDRKGLYAKARRRRDPRVHRHLQPVRGARPTRPSASTPPAAPSRTASTT